MLTIDYTMLNYIDFDYKSANKQAKKLHLKCKPVLLQGVHSGQESGS